MTNETPPVVIAFGDGIGPEIMDAALDILKEAGATLTVEAIEIGARIYDQDGDLGILPSSLKTLKRVGVLLYAPVSMPMDDDGLEPMGDTLCRELGLEQSQRFNEVALELDSRPETFVRGDSFGYASLSDDFAVFTTNQHPTPIMAGDDCADPSALLHAAIMMLAHVGQRDIAARIYNAWKNVMAAGYHTPDMADDNEKDENQRLGTKEFTAKIIEHLYADKPIAKAELDDSIKQLVDDIYK